MWLAVGVNELERGTLYNTLLIYAPDGTLALRHRKLVPTNHERLVWGQGDGAGLDTVDIGAAQIGGLICWENLMPLARFALYERGVEIYLAPTADDSEAWHASMRHIARESRAFVVSQLRVSTGGELSGRRSARAAGDALLGRGGSAIFAPDGDVLARAALGRGGHPVRRPRPGASSTRRGSASTRPGHYHRPDVLSLR